MQIFKIAQRSFRDGQRNKVASNRIEEIQKNYSENQSSKKPNIKVS